jgi:hypothetical protein
LIQPLDDAKPASDGNGAGASTAGNAADSGADDGGATESGGSGPSGGAAPSAGAGGRPSFAGAGGKPSFAGAGGAAPSGGAGGAGPSGPYCARPLTACGGSLIGQWAFQSSCLTLPTQDPSIPAACQGGDAYQSYMFTGSITFTNSAWQSNITEDAVETLKYTTDCLTALKASNASFPDPPASTATCATLASNQIANGASDANCPYVAANGGSCNCVLLFSGSGTGSDTYTLMANNEYVNASDPAGWSPVSYCVQGNVLTVSQTNPGGYTFQHTLTKM